MMKVETQVIWDTSVVVLSSIMILLIQNFRKVRKKLMKNKQNAIINAVRLLMNRSIPKQQLSKAIHIVTLNKFIMPRLRVIRASKYSKLTAYRLAQYRAIIRQRTRQAMNKLGQDSNSENRYRRAIKSHPHYRCRLLGNRTKLFLVTSFNEKAKWKLVYSTQLISITRNAMIDNAKLTQNSVIYFAEYSPLPLLLMLLLLTLVVLYRITTNLVINRQVGITSTILPIVIIFDITLLIYLFIDGNGSRSNANIANSALESAIPMYKFVLVCAAINYRLAMLTLLASVLNSSTAILDAWNMQAKLGTSLRISQLVFYAPQTTNSEIICSYRIRKSKVHSQRSMAAEQANRQLRTMQWEQSDQNCNDSRQDEDENEEEEELDGVDDDGDGDGRLWAVLVQFMFLLSTSVIIGKVQKMNYVLLQNTIIISQCVYFRYISYLYSTSNDEIEQHNAIQCYVCYKGQSWGVIFWKYIVHCIYCITLIVFIVLYCIALIALFIQYDMIQCAQQSQYNKQKTMENQLRKTTIKIKQGIEFHFYKIIKFNRFGCKALYYAYQNHNNTNNNTNINNSNDTVLYDVTVLSKSLLQLNSIYDVVYQNMKVYQSINNRVVCPINYSHVDGDILYIISQAQPYKLYDLVEKREGLTQFQIIYFVLDLIQLMNYLKNRDLFYQIIDLDQIYLTRDMKIMVPFSIWTAHTNANKIKSTSVFRHEDKKSYIAPEFVTANSNDISIDQVAAWNIGVFIYELVEGVKPHFKGKIGEVNWTREVSAQTVQLVQKLLKQNPQERLKFPLILLQPLFKKYPALPFILPTTIFSCPPSSQYISEYCKKFQRGPQVKSHHASKILNIQTAHFLPSPAQSDDVVYDEGCSTAQMFKSVVPKNFKSSKYIKPSDRSLTESKCYITEYVDISHIFGYGYQMSNGLIGFVFNDSTEMYFENSQKKIIRYINEKRNVNEYVYEKITEQSEMKKKLFILQAYAKSIKKFKNSNNQTSTKPVTVNQYFKTNSAAVFLLTNQTVEVIFNDKIIFMLTKHSIHVQNKSSQKFEAYECLIETADLATRKKYAITMVEKLFHWDSIELQRIKAKAEHIQPQTQVTAGKNLLNGGHETDIYSRNDHHY